ncbi:hypothetical protein NKH11_22860, partial [Mesorhizobium sp. M1393]
LAGGAGHVVKTPPAHAGTPPLTPKHPPPHHTPPPPPPRRRPRHIVERDGHEGSRQQAGDEQVDCKDELCAAAHVVFRTPCTSKS